MKPFHNLRIVLLVTILILPLSACSLFLRGPEMVVALPDHPETYHPHRAESPGEAFLAHNAYATLVVRSAATGEVQAGLADRWEASDGFRTFTFRLREGARWSNGEEITAEDVRRSWLSLLDPARASPNAWYAARFIEGAADYAAGISGASRVSIRAVDETTVSVTLTDPLSVFPSVVAHHAFALTHEDPELFSGPFVPEDTGEGRITLVRNRRFYASEAVSVRRLVVISASADGESGARDAEAREAADWYLGFPHDALPGAATDLFPMPHSRPTLDYLLFNVVDGPLASPAARSALSLALDTTAVVEGLFGEGDVPGAPGGVPGGAATGPGLWIRAADKSTDTEAARRRLADAAEASGSRAPGIYQIVVNESPEHRRMAGLLAAQWAETLGIETDVVEEEWPTYLRRRSLGDFQILRAGWLGYYPDDAAILEAFASDAEANDGGYRNHRFDELLLQANSTAPGFERRQLLEEARLLLVEEDVAMIPLFHRRQVDFVDADGWAGWDNPLRGRYSAVHLEPE